MKVEVVLGHKALRVRINGLLHIHLDRAKLLGFSSWEEGRPAHSFAIEFYLSEGAPVLAEYDRRDLWTAILKGLSETLHG